MNRRSMYLSGLAGSLVLAFAACSATTDSNNDFDEPQGPTGPGSGGAATTGATTSTGDGGFNPTTTGSSTGTTGSTCDNPPDADGDGDGWTELEGDCNNCDPNVNPGAVEVTVTEPDGDGGIPEPSDEDCDMQIDEDDAACDMGLGLDDVDPMSGAKAIDLCQTATPGDKKWGVLAANYVRADGVVTNPGLQAGLLDSFGPNVNVQKGERMLGVSSGYARLPGQSGACGGFSCSQVGGGTPPNGFPQDVPGCEGETEINDDVALEVQLRAPTNATGYKFFFKFYSFEFPEYVCTAYNDQFIALVNPAPVGAINGNVSFDSNSNPVSVNIAFFDACDPAGIGNYASVCGGCQTPPNPYCPSGTDQLQGNGFDGSWFQDAGGTSWLQTTAPILPGEEFSVRFTIWDTGDSAWDSTALVDGFQWIANGGTTVVVGTDPIPDPR